MSNTPPLNALRVFESVARLKSFSKAAEELHVSQSAVSRQISLLEGYLEVQFFHRDRTGIRLTELGQQYFEGIQPAFERIADATRNLTAHLEDEPLRIRVYSTFAARWLMHRLPRLNKAHPNLRIRITTAIAPVDFTSERVDAAIQLGDGEWEGLRSDFLFADELRPVCRPKLVSGMPTSRTPEQVFKHRLIHSYYRKQDWSDWFASAGIEYSMEQDPFMLPSSLLAYQAAHDGLGIAIAQTRMVEQELRSGTLIYFCEHTFTRGLGYYLVSQPNSPRECKIACFRDWLMEEIGSRLLPGQQPNP
ncbi:transcriptional regulator GcvA [Pseudomonas fluorescens]|uniref:Glycine cleavage system transcriptional activator n=1 Tax=Pseudomonas fluorescens TaxID=294 RepID=A0A5E7C933_PSEFL|nr:transcriptional regulator GcvA [Pseudomonas fluorescens]VVN98907.1 Glycine cleavage system transcriptional activator [Pseudomonas fluorescens]